MLRTIIIGNNQLLKQLITASLKNKKKKNKKEKQYPFSERFAICEKKSTHTHSYTIPAFIPAHQKKDKTYYDTVIRLGILAWNDDKGGA